MKKEYYYVIKNSNGNYYCGISADDFQVKWSKNIFDAQPFSFYAAVRDALDWVKKSYPDSIFEIDTVLAAPTSFQYFNNLPNVEDDLPFSVRGAM